MKHIKRIFKIFSILCLFNAALFVSCANNTGDVSGENNQTNQNSGTSGGSNESGGNPTGGGNSQDESASSTGGSSSSGASGGSSSESGSGGSSTSGGSSSSGSSSSGSSGSSGGSESGSSTGGTNTSGETKTIGGETYTLVWSDEFTESESDGTPLLSKWGYDIGRGQSKNTDGTNPSNWAWGNNELQWYSEKNPKNTYVSDGTLKIVAKKESSNGAEYTSGRLVTRNISDAQFKYGYIEMSAKIPNDAGVWPAFWMLDNDIYDSPNPEIWPGSGEIDIMETSVNLWKSDVVYGTLHCNAGHSGSPVFTQGTSLSFSDGKFHTYAVDWDDDHIDWYYDNVRVFTYTPVNYENDAWPFCDDFYIILNLAVGGNLGGTVPANFKSSTMEVDYVRVWQKNAGYTDRSGIIEDLNAPSSTPAKTIPEDAVIVFDSSKTANNPITGFENWNGGWASSDYTLADGKTVKQINFSSLNGTNACGGWNTSKYNYEEGTKLCMSVYASQNFIIRPVNPETDFSQNVSSAGTYEWCTVEIDLGSADALTKIGFISTVVQKIYVDHVYLIKSSSSGSTGSGSGESSSLGIDWSTLEWAGDGVGGGTLSNKFKFYAFYAVDEKVDLVNIQKPGFAEKAGLYVIFPSAVTACSLDNQYAIQGDGIILYCDAFTAKETEFTVSLGSTTYKCAVYFADGN